MMRIALLCTQPQLYANQRLLQAAQNRHHQLDFIDIRNGMLELTSQTSKNLSYDAVLPRYSQHWSNYGNIFLQHYEAQGSYPLNSIAHLWLARHKIYATQYLTRCNLPTPRSIIAFSQDCFTEALKTLGPPPYILKLSEGAQGIGVMLAPDFTCAISLLQTLRTLTPLVMIQQYIQEAEHSNLRCLVLGNQVISAVELRANPLEFRANLHRGGQAYPIQLTDEERRLALACTQAFQLQFAGIDLLRSRHGPLVIDINAVPGFKACELVNQCDIATLIIQWLEQQITHS